MADTVKGNAKKIRELRRDVMAVVNVVHDLTKLLMEDKSVPALQAHRGKWKAVLQKLDTIIQQEKIDA